MSVPTDEALRVLAHHVGERLRQGRDHLVTAESCTGGWIAKTVTDIAGSSAWFDCGMAAYSYEAKQALLGVLGLVAVGGHAAVEPVGGAGDVGHRLGDPAAGAAFGGDQVVIAVAQALAEGDGQPGQFGV